MWHAVVLEKTQLSTDRLIVVKSTCAEVLTDPTMGAGVTTGEALELDIVGLN